MAKTWAMNPHGGGTKITPDVQHETKRRIEVFANKHFKGKFKSLDIKFKGQFCYIDAYKNFNPSKGERSPVSGESRQEYIERINSIPTHLCRLRYFAFQKK